MIREIPDGTFVFATHDENVLPALRDAYSEEPLVLDLGVRYLSRVLYERYFLPYKPYEGDVLSALETLAIETGEAG